MDYITALKYLIFFAAFGTVENVSQILAIKNSSVQFNCPHRATSSKSLRWSYNLVYPTLTWTFYTTNNTINPGAPAYPRFNVTGEFSRGEYNLVINNIKDEDKGYYSCYLDGTSIDTVQQLVIVVGPSNVSLQKKDNKLLGKEGQSLQINCTAVGGNPAPDVQILRFSSVVSSGKQTVTYTIPTLQRSDDMQTVTCRAGYIQMNSYPISDSALIHLDLKPLSPQYSQAPTSVIEGHVIDISCTSTGSRPAAVFNWFIDGANITNSSVTSSTADQATFTVTSRLSFTLTKQHNGKTLICKAINGAAPSGVEPNVPITVDVLYPPTTVTVHNVTVTEDTSSVVMTCTAGDGNPDVYTYYEWTHESLQGKLIRRLTGAGNGTLTLPSVDRTQRYQNTGRYICTVGNGIPDTGTKRTGSGVLTVNAPPVFALYNSWTQGGEFKKTVNISVDVYSVPPPNFVWYREETQVSSSGYKTSSSQATVKVVFHGHEVEVSGYKATLTIVEIEEEDFTTYKLRVINSRGSIEQGIWLNSSSAPDQPKNLTVVGQTYESLSIQWEAGYDGGHEQTFYIMYTLQGTGRWTTVTGPKGVRGGTGQIYQTVIGGLDHSTVYEIKMFAQNQRNRSAETMVQIGTTLSKSSGGSTGAIIGGVAGGLSAIVILLIVVLVVLKYRNKSASSDNSTNKLRDAIESDSEGGLQENILYESSGPAPVYSDVVKKKNKAPTSPKSQNDVYAEVNKQPKKKNKAPKGKVKGKGKKNGGINNNSESEYANSDLPLRRISNDEYVNNEDVQVITGRQKNADGLEYADLSFDKQPKTGKLVIHGEERTIYSDIDHTKVGPKPPQEGAYEDTTIGPIKPN